jgi:hypothetical protein
MTAVQPPAIATWFLKRLVSGEKRESLIGDLIEQYQERRSVAWYWRQVFMAILVGATQEIREHKVLAVRAAMSGLALWSLFNWLFLRFVPGFLAEYQFTQPLVTPLGLLMLFCAPTFGSSWIVARLHRPHQVAMVVAYLLSFLVCEFTRPASWLPALGPPAVNNPSVAALVIVLCSGSILLGGLWTAPMAGDS